MADKDDKWISGAIKRPGAFKAKAKAAGKSTAGFARSVLKEGSKASTRTKRQAALAQTLSKIRSGKAKFVVPLVLAALVAPANAANLTCPQGFLTGPTPQTTTGPSVNTVTARAAPAIVVQATNTAGTVTAQAEICCGPLDCTVAANWAPVASGSLNPAATPGSVAVSMLSPTCTYRANVTACTGCSFQAAFACSGP